MTSFRFKKSIFSKKMKDFWNENGFLVIENFFRDHECEEMINRARYLIETNDLNNSNSIFETASQAHKDDNYFLESGDKIRFFFEEKANLNDADFFQKNKQFIVNKIGHALHDLDKVFYKYSHNEKLNLIAKAIGFVKPQLLQSMYIFKQPKIGGEVICHQDSTFLYTEPESAVGFWFALQDATRNNGCLQVAKGGHKGPLRKLFTKVNNKMILKELNDDPFPSTDTVLEVEKGTLVILHGRLPHYSSENTSLNSRHAYTLHIIEGNAKYPKSNWLQRSKMPLRGFIND